MHFATFLIPLLSLVAAHGPAGRRHHARLARSINSTDTELAKRGQSFSGVATWYETGMGACGQWSNSGDFMVALNSAQYGGGYPGPQCFKSITVMHNGATRQATILDECPTCAYGYLDFSPGLFDSFGLGDRTQVGVMDITWWFNDDAPSQPAPSSEAPPPSSSTWQPPSSTWSPPAPSSTSQWVAPSSSSSSTSTAASSSASSSDASSSSSIASSLSASASVSLSASISVSASLSASAAAASATASGLTTDAQGTTGSTDGVQRVFYGENLVHLNVLTAQLGGLVVAGAGVGSA